MQLSKFVQETLSELLAGIRHAQTDAVEGAKGAVCPSSYRKIEFVEFDLAVTASETSGAGGQAGIVVASIGIAGRKDASRSTESVNRVKFRVPVEFPAQY